MADLADQVAKCGVSLHADDTELYLYYCINGIASSVDELECCVLDIGHWIYLFYLLYMKPMHSELKTLTNVTK